MSIFKNIQSSPDLGKYPGRVLIDLCKAFDAADHNIMLKKLRQYSVRTISNKSFRA